MTKELELIVYIRRRSRKYLLRENHLQVSQVNVFSKVSGNHKEDKGSS
ncbi:unnamed protein product [Arabidopsis halleri]